MHDPNTLIRLAAIAESEANCAEMSGMRAQALRRSNLASLAECLRALAAQSATPAAWAVPEGMALVPLVPTDAMLDGVHVEIGCGGYNSCGLMVGYQHAREVWGSMLSAAPQHARPAVLAAPESTTNFKSLLQTAIDAGITYGNDPTDENLAKFQDAKNKLRSAS